MSYKPKYESEVYGLFFNWIAIMKGTYSIRKPYTTKCVEMWIIISTHGHIKTSGECWEECVDKIISVIENNDQNEIERRYDEL